MDPYELHLALIDALAAETELEDDIGPGSSALSAWQTFCTLAIEPVDDIGDDIDDDMLSFSANAYALDDAERTDLITISVRRTCTSYDDGVPVRDSSDLSIEFRRPSEDIALTERSVFGYAGPVQGGVPSTHPEIRTWVGHASAWVDAVESSDAFRALESSGALRFSWRFESD